MNRHLLLFGSGTHFANGSLPDCVGFMRTGGLNGTIQPYKIFVAEPHHDGPFEQRSKFTSNPQDESLYKNDNIFKEGKMISTEYTKGHGSTKDNEANSVADDSGGKGGNNSSPTNSEKETVHIVHVNPYTEKVQEEGKTVKMSRAEFDKNVAELSEKATTKALKSTASIKRPAVTEEKNAKKMKIHKFQLI